MRLGEVHRGDGGDQVEKRLRQNKGHNLAPFTSTSLHRWPSILECTTRHNGHPWTRTLPAALAGVENRPLRPCKHWYRHLNQHGYHTYISLSRFLSLSHCCLIAVSLLSVALARCSRFALALLSRCSLAALLLLSRCSRAALSLLSRCSCAALSLLSRCSLAALAALSLLSCCSCIALLSLSFLSFLSLKLTDLVSLFHACH